MHITPGFFMLFFLLQRTPSFMKVLLGVEKNDYGCSRHMALICIYRQAAQQQSRAMVQFISTVLCLRFFYC